MNTNIDYILKEFDSHGIKLEKKDETTLVAKSKYPTGIQRLEYISPNLCLLYPRDKDEGGNNISQVVLKNLKAKLEATGRQLTFKGIKLLVKDDQDLNPEQTTKTIQQYYASRLNGLEQTL